ncbi:MAG: 23S rRNA (uracil(1939)-C(5))-methyltransferase RlmD [Clostridia bacterium]|nr:23S rRNA (uracil(1939)-C(5))-methyltransferase RlmD [Clostridia bacterium]
MKKNDIVTLKIEGMSAEGSGIGKVDSMAVFVPLAAVGDELKVKIVKVKSRYCYGIIEEIIKPSANRTGCDCEVFRRCGGCVYRHISYESECNIKFERVYNAVKRIGEQDMLPCPIISANSVNRYRNKAQYPVTDEGKAGFFATHSHRIIPCDDCRLQPEEFTKAAELIGDWIRDNGISVYNEAAHTGLIRHIYVRKAFATGQLMVCLVINGDYVPFKDKLIDLLVSNFGENLKSVQLNINTKNTNVILGDKCKLLYGEEYITDVLCGVKIRISPLSFYQVNRDMAEKLYLKAAEYVQPKNKNILDLYCGAGTIGLSMAKAAKTVIGVEIIPEAIEDAKYNAENNGIENVRFICADAKAAAEQLAREGIRPDAVIVDPPRKGCDGEVLKIIAENFAPQRIVYVSCDPATLARDIKILNGFGYSLSQYTPVDLFPRTAHVECCVLLCRES